MSWERRNTACLALALTGVLGLARAAEDSLGEPWVSPLAGFRIRPPAGLTAVPEDTPEVQVLFLGTVADRGPVSMNVVFYPGRDADFRADEATARRIQQDVVSEMDGAQPLEVDVLPPDHPSGRGFDMEFLVFQRLGDERRPMVMIQRQLAAPDGLYNLTATCLESSWKGLGGIVRASFDSFRVLDETADATPEELILDATFRFSRGDLETALELAARVGSEAAFAQRVAALRIRLAGLLALGKLAEVRDLVRPYITLWTEDDRAYSAHHSWSLRRGRGQFFRNLRLLEDSKLPPEDRATLAAVALTTWAGPPDALPPRLSKLQDEFYGRLKEANWEHPRDPATNWRLLEPLARRVAEEVQDYLVRYEASAATGRVTPRFDEEGVQWLTSSVPLALVHAIRHQDRARFRDVLDRYGRILARIPGATEVHDPTRELRTRMDELMEFFAQPFREIDYRLASMSGQDILDRTRELLEEGGLEGLEKRLDPMKGP